MVNIKIQRPSTPKCHRCFHAIIPWSRSFILHIWNLVLYNWVVKTWYFVRTTKYHVALEIGYHIKWQWMFFIKTRCIQSNHSLYDYDRYSQILDSVMVIPLYPETRQLLWLRFFFLDKLTRFNWKQRLAIFTVDKASDKRVWRWFVSVIISS